ncbi:MAG: hypothetical protein A2X97_14080 [Bdellovibrionales bacterium GWA1_52_35]|nr:MAG: hypothetical protein A2X97_14080 [Bdellovibrionales bacterium GWA1_52_35]
MASYTNVYINDGTSREERLQDEVHQLRFEKEVLQDKLERVRKEIANIPAAVREWGWVEISDDTGKIKLIAAIEVK